MEVCEIEFPSPSSWIPAGLFALLAGFFLQKAIRSRARRTWGWGRVGGPVRVSRAGYGAWGVTFLVIASVLAYGQRPPPVLMILLGACVVGIVAVGALDTRAHRHRSPPPSKRVGE